MKFRASEGFSRGERESIDGLLARFGQLGVLTGALTDEKDEFRPVLLVNGHLVILRSFIVDDIEKRSQFLEALQKIKRFNPTSFGNVPLVLDCGVINNEVWFTRPYAAHLLMGSEKISGEKFSEEQGVMIIRTVAAQLDSMHRAGVVHGNVSVNNVVYDLPSGEGAIQPTTKFSLVDSAVSLSGRQSPANSIIAPESRDTKAFTKEIDIYALGILAERLLYRSATPSIKRLIEAMTSIDPKDRPSAMEVSSALDGSMQFDFSRGVREANTRGRIIAGATIKRGGSEQGSVSSSQSDKSTKVNSQAVEQVGSKNPGENTPSKGINISSRTIMSALFGGIFIGILGALILKFSSSPVPSFEYWMSGQPDLMSEVARDAIKYPDSESAKVIVRDILNGNDRSQTRARFLRSVFNPLWSDSLSSEDKRAALSLGLLNLVPLTEAPPHLEELHPALLFSVLSDLSVRTDLGQTAGLPISILTHLPAPIGESIKLLARTGVKTIGDPATRALAHIFTSDLSPEVLRGYFSEGDARTRLAAILPIISSDPGMTEKIFEFLPDTTDQVANMLLWFGVQDSPHWNNAEPLQIVSIIAGIVPDTGLSFDQLSDLIRFPDSTVAEQVVPLLLQQGISKEDESFLKVIAGEKSKLDRLQAMSLVAGLQVKGEARFGFFSNWFKMKPDAGTVVDLLVTRSAITQLDPFSLEASRYLKDRSWNATTQQLNGLSQHSDPLARALAYVKLDPSIPEHRIVLENALKSEKNERLIEEVKDRLGLSKPEDLPMDETVDNGLGQ